MPSSSSKDVPVYIAESQAVTRAALTALITEADGLQVAGSCGSIEESLRNLPERLSAVVLVSPDLPDVSPAVIRRASIDHPDLKIVVLSSPERLEEAIELVFAGANGCHLTSDPPESLLDGLRAAARGDTALSGAVARRLFRLRDTPQPVQATDALSEREQEVLSLLAEGMSNKEIAQKLYLSVRTVEAHLRSIYPKLGARSRLEAVKYLRRVG